MTVSSKFHYEIISLTIHELADTTGARLQQGEKLSSTSAMSSDGDQILAFGGGKYSPCIGASCQSSLRRGPDSAGVVSSPSGTDAEVVMAAGPAAVASSIEQAHTDMYRSEYFLIRSSVISSRGFSVKKQPHVLHV
jgi:hypothetical protein